MNLVLYGKKSCSLCEKAEIMLNNLGLNYSLVDIEGDKSLWEEYRLLIPVLYLENSKQELLYPFDEYQISKFVKKNSNLLF